MTPTAHYWGLSAIAERLGLKSPQAVMRLYRECGLPLLRGRRGSHPRVIWYSNERLLLLFELNRVKRQRQEWLEAHKQKDQARQ